MQLRQLCLFGCLRRGIADAAGARIKFDIARPAALQRALLAVQHQQAIAQIDLQRAAKRHRVGQRLEILRLELLEAGLDVGNLACQPVHLGIEEGQRGIGACRPAVGVALENCGNEVIGDAGGQLRLGGGERNREAEGILRAAEGDGLELYPLTQILDDGRGRRRLAGGVDVLPPGEIEQRVTGKQFLLDDLQACQRPDRVRDRRQLRRDLRQFDEYRSSRLVNRGQRGDVEKACGGDDPADYDHQREPSDKQMEVEAQIGASHGDGPVVRASPGVRRMINPWADAIAAGVLEQ